MSPDNFDELMNIQRRMQKKLQEEKQMDDTVNVIMLINELAPHSGQRIQKEQILIEGSLRGFGEEHLEKVIKRLIRDRILYIPSPGYIARK